MTTPTVRGVYIANVEGLVSHRETKHCVCISVSNGKYFLINTRSLGKHDDFMIKASDYDFLRSEDRYLSCSDTFDISPDRLIKKVGTLSVDDTHKLAGKIIRSQTILKPDKDIIINELREALRG